MRLWSIHPEHLDHKGLVALWREGLLALAVLQGKTRGYTNHPQLDRFKKQKNPIASLSKYMHHVYHEAERRGYHFDKSKLPEFDCEVEKIFLQKGQLSFEKTHLKKKLALRSPGSIVKKVRPHPIFVLKKGDKEHWERG